MSCRVTDRGTIRFKMHDGIERVFVEVIYVPGLKRKSLGVLDKK